MYTEPLLPLPGSADAELPALAASALACTVTCDAEWPDAPGRARVAALPAGSARVGVEPARSTWTWTAGAQLTPAAR